MTFTLRGLEQAADTLGLSAGEPRHWPPWGPEGRSKRNPDPNVWFSTVSHSTYSIVPQLTCARWGLLAPWEWDIPLFCILRSWLSIIVETQLFPDVKKRGESSSISLVHPLKNIMSLFKTSSRNTPGNLTYMLAILTSIQFKLYFQFLLLMYWKITSLLNPTPDNNHFKDHFNLQNLFNF